MPVRAADETGAIASDAQPLRRWGVQPAKVVLTRHWLFGALTLLGIALRVLVQTTYWPAMLFFDSIRYIRNIYVLDPGDNKPLGYTVVVRALVVTFGDLSPLSLLNHLLGIAIAFMIYATLVRRGVRPWMAALSVGPVLLDAFQLLIEQMVMSDVQFEFLVVTGIVVLLWRPTGLVTAGAAGAVFALAALTRYVGLPLLLAGALYCLLATSGLVWRRIAVVSALVAGFALPLLGYATLNFHETGRFAASPRVGIQALYARAAVSADCPRLVLPAYERPLCPPPGVVSPQSGSLVQGYVGSQTSPLVTFHPPRGRTQASVLHDFVRRVALQQPLRLVAAVGKNFARPFLSWTRTRKTGELPISRWQFQTKFPQFVVSGASSKAVFRYWEEGTLPRTHARAARALRAYQFHIGFTPGLVLLTCLVLGLVAAAGVGPARHAGQRAACLLWVATGVGLLLVADTYQFSWRYQLPALVTLPPAAALALSALTRARRVTGPEQLSGKEARAPGADAEGPGPAAAPPVHL